MKHYLVKLKDDDTRSQTLLHELGLMKLSSVVVTASKYEIHPTGCINFYVPDPHSLNTLLLTSSYHNWEYVREMSEEEEVERRSSIISSIINPLDPTQPTKD